MKSKLCCFYVALVAALLASCGGDNTVSPPAVMTARITGVDPSVVSLGAQAQPVEILGSGFVSVTSVDLGSGINILSREIPDSGRIQLLVNVSRTAQPGPRMVVVNTSTGTASLDAALEVSNNQAPQAQFSVSPSEGTVSSVFTFDAGASTDADGTIATYKWQISDGANPKGRKVQHTFAAIGDYTVRLTITDDKGGISTVEKTVTVGDNLPPVAQFTVTPSSGTSLTVFAFDASASNDPDGSIMSYKWDFGDGGAGQGMRVTHRYKEGGDYQVQLTVTDSKMARTMVARKVSVEFFDIDKAKREITDTITTFLRLFGNFENLSAEEIVVGFSRSPSCPGRAHEISIIESEQPVTRSQGVKNIEVVVLSVSEKSARADASAEFYGVTTSGDEYDGYRTHHFTMTNENGEWLMCSFYLTD